MVCSRVVVKNTLEAETQYECFLAAEILQPIAYDRKFFVIPPSNQPLKFYFQKESWKFLWAMLDNHIDDEKFPPGTVVENVCVHSRCRHQTLTHPLPSVHNLVSL